jgi:hypothetical protein
VVIEGVRPLLEYLCCRTNRSPHKVLENKTPEEMFSREKQEASDFRIFGCFVFVHVPKEKRTKLDPSEQKGIFVGYSDTLKAYRIHSQSPKSGHQSRCNLQ